MYTRLEETYYKEIQTLLTLIACLLVINLAFTISMDFMIFEDEPKEAVEQVEQIEEVAVETVEDEMHTIDISSREMHAVDPRPAVNQEELELLACVIYQEAGGNECCDECRRRVADVVLNRVNDPRFPNDIRSVLTAPKQYGLLYKTGAVWADRASNPGEKAAVDRAYRIAEEVLLGQHSELYGNGYIWQAEFKQGTEQVYHCGIYFGR